MKKYRLTGIDGRPDWFRSGDDTYEQVRPETVRDFYFEEAGGEKLFVQVMDGQVAVFTYTDSERRDVRLPDPLSTNQIYRVNYNLDGESVCMYMLTREILLYAANKHHELFRWLFEHLSSAIAKQERVTVSLRM